MNFLNLAEHVAAMDLGQVHLEPGRCLYSRDQFSGCTRCFEICPEGAIQPGRPPGMKEEACMACLACVPACPAGAYRAADKVTQLFTCASRMERPALELLCGLHPAPQKGPDPARPAVQITTCLASLGVGVYAGLRALGFTQVQVRTDACAHCRWHNLKAVIQQQAAQAGAFLAGWEPAATVTCLDTLENPLARPLAQAKDLPLSRRDLFRLAGRSPQAPLARALNPAADENETLPPDRLRLLAAVAQLQAPTQPGAVALQDLGFATLAVADSCTACGVCARNCPTGALQFTLDENQARFALALEPHRCTGCAVCTHVCAPAAITLDPALAFAAALTPQRVALQTGELAKCQRCGARMVSRAGAHLCPVCDFRSKNPLRSGFPPGFKPGKRQG